jgi:hypothetical protein
MSLFSGKRLQHYHKSTEYPAARDLTSAQDYANQAGSLRKSLEHTPGVRLAFSDTGPVIA